MASRGKLPPLPGMPGVTCPGRAQLCAPVQSIMRAQGSRLGDSASPLAWAPFALTVILSFPLCDNAASRNPQSFPHPGPTSASATSVQVTLDPNIPCALPGKLRNRMDVNHPRHSAPLPAPTPTRLTSSQPFARYPSPTRRAGFDPGVGEEEEKEEKEEEEEVEVEEKDDADADDAEDRIYHHDETRHDMWDQRPAVPTGPEDGRSTEPLLKEGAREQRGRGVTSYEGIRETDERTRRRHLFRSRSPSSADAAR
jgi:hypothetical protein